MVRVEIGDVRPDTVDSGTEMGPDTIDSGTKVGPDTVD